MEDVEIYRQNRAETKHLVKLGMMKCEEHTI